MEGGSPGHWGRNTNEGPTPAPNRTSTGLNRTPRMLRYRIHCRGAGGSTNGKEARIDFGSRSLSAHRLTVYRPRPLRCKLATGDAPACRLALYQQEHRNGGLSPLHRRVAGIDVHRMLHVVTVLIEQPDGSVVKHSREFGYFKRDCRALATWLLELQVQLVVMESTGIYWKTFTLTWRISASPLGSSTHTSSSTCRVAKPTCSIPNSWPASALCAAASFPRKTCASCA